MPFAASSTFGEEGLKSSWKVPAAPVVIVSTLLLVPLGEVLPLPLVVLLEQAASVIAAAKAAPAAIDRTRLDLDDIADSFSLSLQGTGRSATPGLPQKYRCARDLRPPAAGWLATLFGYPVPG